MFWFPYFQAYFHISKHISTFQRKFPHFQEDFLRDSKSIPGKVFKSANIWPAVSFDPKSVNAWYQRKLSQRIPLQCLQKHNFLFSLPSLKGFRLDRCALEKGVGQSFSAKLPTQNVPPCMPMRPLNPCYFQQIQGKNWNISKSANIVDTLKLCCFSFHGKGLEIFEPWKNLWFLSQELQTAWLPPSKSFLSKISKVWPRHQRVLKGERWINAKRFNQIGGISSLCHWWPWWTKCYLCNSRATLTIGMRMMRFILQCP